MKSQDPANDAFVLTRTKPCGPFSFLDPVKTPYKENRPAPTYLHLTDVNAKKVYNMENVLADFKVEKNGELKLTNDDLKERQKGVIGDIIKKFASKIGSGNGFIGLSAPIRIFEARSQIERLCDCLHYFPHYLNLAADTNDTVERIKYVLTAIFAAIPHCLSQWKPFNPLLGETYEASIGSDTHIFMEHISHVPPISSLYMVNPRFKVYGSWTYDARVGPNKLSIFNEGFTTIEFFDGQKIKFFFPTVQLRGLIMGTRTMRLVHSFIAFDEASGIKGVVTFSDGSTGKGFFSNMFAKGKVDFVTGSIYKYDQKAHDKTMAKGWYSMIKGNDAMGDVSEEIVKISGSVLDRLVFNETVYWQFEANKADSKQQIASDNPLPSDCRFREDLIWLFYGNEKVAQEWKTQLEVQQRTDRSNRGNKKGAEKTNA